MPTVENFTPELLWATIYGVIGLCILFMVVYKVYDAIRNEVERKRTARAAREPDLADRVSKKVLENLEPRFQEIEQNLARDKRRLDDHDALFVTTKQSQEDTKDGLIAICKTLLVITSAGDSANGDKLKEAHDELTKYLACRL